MAFFQDRECGFHASLAEFLCDAFHAVDLHVRVRFQIIGELPPPPEE